jgi:hypothetical protein
MTATPPSSATTRIHVVSARTTNNPYALIDLRCAKVKTKEHSQFIGILSFALFIVLTVVSFVIFEADAIFFIVFGIFIYAFLTESLFRIPRPCGVLLYLVFETLQIGFYIATMIFILVEMAFSSYDDDNLCSNTSTTKTTTTTTATTSSSIPTTTVTPTTTTTPLPATTKITTFATTTPDCIEPVTTAEAILEIVVFLLLMSIKIYFIKVFTQFYKFINYQEHHSNELRAQYVNGRGVNIRFPDPAYDNPVVNDPAYGYNLYPHSAPLPDLPSYHQAMTTTKNAAASSPSTPTVHIAPPQYPTSEATNPHEQSHPTNSDLNV